MLPQHLAPHMKDDVRRETQRLKHLFLCGNDTHLSKLNSWRNTIMEDTRMLKEMNISIIRQTF